MAVKWTEEQEQVIALRDRNLLVSAAAGSGKTAVLVERILSRVTDPVNPIDIDRLLVVTFTKAAAGEMRERIGKALEERLAKEPDNEHLQRQGILLDHAQISTIHGFCTYVIQNYFHRISLDPGYRIADENELKLMMGDVLKDMLEEEHAEGRAEFLDFTDAFAAGREDRRLEELIKKVYRFADSDPWPEEWLEGCERVYSVETVEELEQTEWLRAVADEAKRLLAGAAEQAGENLKLAEGPGGPKAYLPQVTEDLELVRNLCRSSGYRELYEAFQKLKFASLSPKKSPDEDPAVRKRVGENRNVLKKALDDLKKHFADSPEEILKELAVCRPHVKELVRLTGRFMEEFSARKRRKNVLSFSDLEHFALEILLKRTPEGWERTDAARELSEHFAEIMIDEYQDSNYVQEYLLEAVAGTGRGVYNRFMVGDMKQAIYSFRQARPELFLEKYNSYRSGEENCRRIDLSQNFRSRSQVVNTVNFFFGQIMRPELGGLAYDDAAALHLGAKYPEPEDASFPETEVLLIDRKSPEFDDDRSQTAMIEAEALAVAQKIRSLVGHAEVADRDAGGFRPLQYRDCVVLLRSASGWAENFVRVLLSEGIPAHATSKTGYFSAPEVETVLNYLQICDNPRQDIPFTAILRSPIVGCTDRELALVRCHSPEASMYEAAAAYEETGEEEGLRRKLRAFRKQLEGLRGSLSDTPVHQVIRRILEETGYGAWAAAMPGGEQREANLNMLVEKAVSYEKTSYHGLFHFLRYVEQLKQYQVDCGEVSLYGETADTVRIMTIHKSKGLEFPVVFVSGLGKEFNQMDLNSAVLLHAGLGIGLDAVDTEKRVRKPTVFKQAVRQTMKKELLGEELRVLYVAMTRAKEKLILTAVTSDLEKKVSGYAVWQTAWAAGLPYGQLASARSFLDWILAALSRSRCFAPLYHMAEGAAEPAAGWPYDSEAEAPPIRIQVLTPAQMTLSQMEDQAGKELALERLETAVRENPDGEITEFLRRKETYRYPYEHLAAIPAKMTVSELKRAGDPGTEQEEEAGFRVYEEPEIIPYIPRFMRQEGGEEAEGAARGTAYHRVLECLDYCGIPQDVLRPRESQAEQSHSALVENLQEQLDGMIRDGKLDAVSAASVELRDIGHFLESPVGRRMTAAAQAGRLWREQPFSLAVPASELRSDWQAEQGTVLVQGIIDAYFEEEGRYVIVDYKTDKVYSRDGRDLAEKYGRQLFYYRMALEQATGREVKEMLIYSVTLGREIPVGLERDSFAAP